MTEPARRKYLRWTLRVLAATIGVLALFLLVVACTVALLPTFLSTPWLKGLVEVELSQAVKREVRIETVLWTWAGGILIEEATVADDPDFSDIPIAAIRKVRIRTGIRSLFKDRFDVDVVVDGLSVHFVRKKDGDANFGKWLADLAPGGPDRGEETDVVSAGETERSLPFDVNARVHLRQMSVIAEDRTLPSRLVLTDGEVLLDIPSLAEKPVTLIAGSNLTLDGRDLPPLGMTLSATGLFGPNRKLTLNRMKAEAEADLPGVRLKMTGAPAQQKERLNGRLDLDLPVLFNVARPLLPAGVSGLRPQGKLTLTLDAARTPGPATAPDPNRTELALNATLDGENLAVSGLPAPGETIGPLDFSFQHQGAVDFEGGEIRIERGSLQLMDETRMIWRGAIAGAFDPSPELDLRIGPVTVDIREMLSLAEPFMPTELEMDIGDEGTDPPRLALASLDLFRKSGEEALEMIARRLELTVPRLTVEPEAAGMALAGVEIFVPSLQARLLNGFPETLSLSARLRAETCRQGKDGVAASSLEATNIAIHAEEVRPAQHHLSGISGRIRGTADLSVGRCELPGAGTLEKTAFSLAASAAPNPDGSTDLRVASSKLEIGGVRLRAPRFTPPHDVAMAGLAFGATGGMHIRGDDISSISLEGVDCRFDLGDILAFRLNADGKPHERIKAVGDLSLNLTAFQKAFPGLLGEKTVGGRSRIRAFLDGRAPEAAEIAALSDLSGFDVRKRLAFLREFELSADLDGVTASMAPSGEKRLAIGPIRTTKPLSYRFSTGSGQGALAAEMTVQKVQGVAAGLQGIARKLPARLSLSVEHGGAGAVETLKINQRLRIRSLPLDQDLTIDLGGLDRVLKDGGSEPTALWLKRLAGTVKGQVKLGPDMKADNLLPGLVAEGGLTAGFRAALASGKRVSAGLSLESRGMSLRQEGGLEVEGAQIHLDIEKGYRLRFESEQVSETPDKLPLSVSVMGSDPDSIQSPEGGGAGRFMDRLRRRYTDEHPLSFDRALVGLTLGRSSLAIENAMVDIGLKSGLPGSEFFQADLLGGTLMGALGLAKDLEGFYLRTRIAFTGIDSRKLLPGNASATGSSAEIGGELTLRMPLATRMPSFLSGLQLTATLSPIGARALERFLYALDPYESNESIVAQRRLLRRGTPRWVRVRIQNGALSLTGQVAVGGTRIAIPPIDRLNIANIGGIARYEGVLAHLGPVVDLLETLAAETLAIDQEGSVYFK